MPDETSDKGLTAGGDGRSRGEQLAYSEQMAAMLDETKRRKKAQKILAVVRHALGRAFCPSNLKGDFLPLNVAEIAQTLSERF